MAGNANYDEILSSTLHNYRDTFEDNVFGSMAVLWWMEQGGLKKGLDGGDTIVEQLMYGKNDTAGSYSGYDPLRVMPQTGLTAAEYAWKQCSVSITIDGLTEMKNWGRERIINLLEAKILQAEESMRDEMARMLFTDGSGNDSKDINGFPYFLTLSGAQTATIGGIDQSAADNAWWRNFTAATADFNATTYDGITAMRTMYNTCSKGKTHPDIIIGAQTLFEQYEGMLLPLERFNDRKLGDAGFENLKFKGANFIYDEYCTALNIYMLTTKYMRWIYHTQRNFVTTPFMRPENQDAKTAQILWMGNLTFNQLKRQGRQIFS